MIMIKESVKYSIFGNYEFMEASPDTVAKLYEIFGSEQFLPNMIQLLQIEQPKNTVNRVQRPQFINESMKCGITFLPERIDIEVRDGNEIDLDIIIGYFQRVIETFQLGITRLALNTSVFFNVPTVDAAILARKEIITEKSFPYGEEMLEWSSRNVARKQCEDLNELVNVGQNVQSWRIALEEQTLISQIKVDTDINTLAEKNSERFNIETSKAFFIQAEKWNKEMFENLEGLV